MAVAAESTVTQGALCGRDGARIPPVDERQRACGWLSRGGTNTPATEQASTQSARPTISIRYILYLRKEYGALANPSHKAGRDDACLSVFVHTQRARFDRPEDRPPTHDANRRSIDLRAQVGGQGHSRATATSTRAPLAAQDSCRSSSPQRCATTPRFAQAPHRDVVSCRSRGPSCPDHRPAADAAARRRATQGRLAASQRLPLRREGMSLRCTQRDAVRAVADQLSCGQPSPASLSGRVTACFQNPVDENGCPSSSTSCLTRFSPCPSP